MKKLISILIIFILLFLFGCNSNNNNNDNSKNEDKKADEGYIDFGELVDADAKYLYIRKLGDKQLKILLEDNDCAKAVLAFAENAPKKEFGLVGPRYHDYYLSVKCNQSFEHDDKEYTFAVGDVLLSGRNFIVIYDTSSEVSTMFCIKIGKIVGISKEDLKEYFNPETSHGDLAISSILNE